MHPDAHNYASQDGAHRETVAVTMNEILLRGCTLKNSGFVVGLVVYTGPESRIQMNAAEPPRKQGGQACCFLFGLQSSHAVGADDTRPAELYGICHRRTQLTVVMPHCR